MEVKRVYKFGVDAAGKNVTEGNAKMNGVLGGAALIDLLPGLRLQLPVSKSDLRRSQGFDPVGNLGHGIVVCQIGRAHV